MTTSAHPDQTADPTKQDAVPSWAHLVTPTPIQTEHPVPAHVAIIMDGNGRWAKERGLPRLTGHERGTDNIRRITSAAVEAGVSYLTLWAFSTENWRRPREEVEGIIRILGMCLVRDVDELHRQGVQLRHIGDLDGLPDEMRDQIHAAIELTQHNDRIVLTLAFNYGGRSEMIRAIRALVATGVAPEEITEDAIASHLYTAGMPDPDLIIRTSGEHRISNFMVWQGAYSELFFTNTYWPDFGPEHLREAVDDYSQRERRFGHVAALTAPSQ
ncbi:MAG TPA: isoprenyl transferase [Thermomicrobiales bacterium]|jgi:undecaprenyl diphosphate synthase|nr:isoprenyl transferase [Thermomicrobiales bacterium]